MSAWWLLLAFALGIAVDYKLGKYALRLLGRRSKWADDAIRRLDHDTLVSVHRKTEAELERRRAA